MYIYTKICVYIHHRQSSYVDTRRRFIKYFISLIFSKDITATTCGKWWSQLKRSIHFFAKRTQAEIRSEFTQFWTFISFTSLNGAFHSFSQHLVHSCIAVIPHAYKVGKRRMSHQSKRYGMNDPYSPCSKSKKQKFCVRDIEPSAWHTTLIAYFIVSPSRAHGQVETSLCPNKPWRKWRFWNELERLGISPFFCSMRCMASAQSLKNKTSRC